MTMLHEEKFKKAAEVLGFDPNNFDKDISIKKIINIFSKKDINNEELILSKNEVILHLIKERKLSYVPKIHIKNICKHCYGIGFNIKFFKLEEEKCPKCNGTGWKIGECKKCSGTGKIGEIDCKTCKGRGTYLFKRTLLNGEVHFPGKKCVNCRGKGTIKKLNQDPKIQETTKCTKCKGTGLNFEIGTQLISNDLGKKLKSMVA